MSTEVLDPLTVIERMPLLAPSWTEPPTVDPEGVLKNRFPVPPPPVLVLSIMPAGLLAVLPQPITQTREANTAKKRKCFMVRLLYGCKVP